MSSGDNELAPLAYSNEPTVSLEKQGLRKRKRENKKRIARKRPKKTGKKGNTSWCNCKCRVPMKTEIESICCMESFTSDTVTFDNPLGHPFCITTEEHFSAAVLNRTTLKIAWIQYDMVMEERTIDSILIKLVLLLLISIIIIIIITIKFSMCR